MPVTVNSEPPPPKKVTVAAASKAAATSQKTREKADAVNSLFQFAQLPLIATKNFADAGAVLRHGTKISLEVARLADQDERVNELVERLMVVGPYAALIAAVLPLAIQVGVNHEAIPDVIAGSVDGVVTKSQMESEMKSALLKTEIEALRYQREVEEEARAAREEWDAYQAEVAAAEELSNSDRLRNDGPG